VHSAVKSFDQANPFRIGMIGLIVTAALTLSAQNFDKVSILSAHITYTAEFAEAAGLKPGDPVQVGGFQVGKVTDIELEAPNVAVRFTADGVLLGTETRAAIKTRTVLGSKVLRIEPSGDGSLSASDVIPTSRTTSPYLLTDSLGELSTTISRLDTNQITSALDTLSATLDKSAPNLKAALDGVSRFSESIGKRDEALRGMLANANDVSGVLSSRSAQINALLVDGSTLFGALDSRRRAVDELLVNVRAVAAQVSGFVEENQQQMRPTLDSLNAVIGILDKHREDLKNTIKPLQQYAMSLGESVSGGPFFKAYIGNLLPGQFLQPFIDAAFKQEGIDPGALGTSVYPVPGGFNTPPGTVPPGGTTPVPGAAPGVPYGGGR